MSSDYDVEMSTDDTLELNYLKERLDTNNVSISSNKPYDEYETQENKYIFDPQEKGNYTIKYNGNELTVKVDGAIPETAMFQSPIYQWWGDAGVSGSDWTDDKQSITATGTNTSNVTQSGFEAWNYNGSSSEHNWSADGNLPTGTSSVSWVGLVYPNTTDASAIVGHDDMRVGINNTNWEVIQTGRSNLHGPDVTTDQWQTVGLSYDGSEIELFVGGSSQGKLSSSTSLSAQNEVFGYRAENNDLFFNGYLAEVVYSATAEIETAFSEYHSDRLE